jgi:hypothetical protein
MSAFRKDFPTNTLYEINGGSATGMSNSGSASAWSMRSFFSRVNYSYNGRYLFEANMRSDATSRFLQKVDGVISLHSQQDGFFQKRIS